MSKKSPKRPKPARPYKSHFEVEIAEQLRELKIKAVYEPSKLPYTLNLNYTPDWIVYPNGIIIEAKGKLDGPTRQKMLAVKKAHPHLDIRFVFMKASNKIRKGSKTTYGDWATKNGFKWADGSVPKAWVNK